MRGGFVGGLAKKSGGFSKISDCGKMPKKGKNGRERSIAKKYAKKTCFITYFFISVTHSELGHILTKTRKNK